MMANVRPQLNSIAFLLVFRLRNGFAPSTLNGWKTRKANELQICAMVSDTCIKGVQTRRGSLKAWPAIFNPPAHNVEDFVADAAVPPAIERSSPTSNRNADFCFNPAISALKS